MTREAQLDKLRRNYGLAACPLPLVKAERLAGLIAELEEIEDVAALVDELVP